MSGLLAAALDSVRRGWSVIPIGKDKKPPIKWKKYQAVRAPEATLRGWCDRRDITGIGVVFGAVSGGLASRDFDRADAYYRWAERNADLAMMLPTVQTARGYHVYFRADEERYATYTDGEYRGDTGHYSVLPPSLHPSGVRYTWKIPLPEAGEIVRVDAESAGLLAEASEDDQCNRENPAMASVISVDSVPSVVSVLSVTWADDLESTVPTGPGQRNDAIFKFARTLKARPECADAKAWELEPVLREWHQRALPKIGTKCFDETRIDFNHAWERVKYPMGTGPIEETMRRADAMAPPPEAMRYDSQGVRRLVSLCALLQANAGRDVFFLDCRTAAKVLGVTDHVSAWRWLGLLRTDGLLVMTERGKNGRASRWRWTGTLTTPAKPGG